MARVVQVLTRQSLGLPPLPSTPVPAPVRKPGILGRAMSTPLPLHPGLAVPGPSTLSRRVLDTLEKIHEDRAWTHPVPVESSGPTLPISGAVSLAQLSSSTDGRTQRRRLAKRVLGEKKLRAVEAKQKKAAKRRHLHTARLRASVGERSILETIDIGSDSQEDYAKRLLSFWGFAARWKISLSQPTQYDAAAVDWADFQYLDGEGPDHGERLRAALERWSISALRTGCLGLPRFKRVLKSWKKNHPKKSRLPMPEEFSWAITGWLGHVVGYESALYHACLFASYLRPGALLGLYATSVVPPTEELGVASHYVLIVSPFEKEVSTKTGYFDETVVMDGTFCPCMGELVHRHALRRLAGAAGDEDVGLWNLNAKDFLVDWRAAAVALRLSDMETPYQARHGAASRDYLGKVRTAVEIQLRLMHSTTSSLRTYNKPGRIQKLVNDAPKAVIEYAGRIKAGFRDFILDGSFPAPPSPAPPRGLKRKSLVS